jgi:hypothetical protein
MECYFSLDVARQKNQSESLYFEFHVFHVATGYFNYQHDVVLMNPLFAGAPIVYVGSSRVIQQLLGNEAKLRLVKPVELTLQSYAYTTMNYCFQVDENYQSNW